MSETMCLVPNLSIQSDKESIHRLECVGVEPRVPFNPQRIDHRLPGEESKSSLRV